jgi:hypothetical protein
VTIGSLYCSGVGITPNCPVITIYQNFGPKLGQAPAFLVQAKATLTRQLTVQVRAILSKKMVCQNNILFLFFMREKSMHYPGIEPITFGVTIGYVSHCFIEVAAFSAPEIKSPYQ